MNDYKISAIIYTKPKVILDRDGEPISARQVWMIKTDTLFELYMGCMRKVTRIEYNASQRLFYVHFEETNKVFKKKAIYTVPMLFDTEVIYEEG